MNRRFGKYVSVMMLTAALIGCTAVNGETYAADGSGSTVTTVSVASVTESSDEYFTERDLKQTADLTDAVSYTVEDGQNITISEEGVYVLHGSAKEVTVTVDAADEAKVQIVLDGVTITNTDAPCIYVKNADKVFVTLTDSMNALEVTGTFTADGDTNTDAVIFSEDDLVLNGTGTLTIQSTDNAVTSKDDLKVTGGTYVITCTSKAFETNDLIAVADGTFTINAGTDGLHSENDDDSTLGSIYIENGTFAIDAGDDGVHAAATIAINGGTFDINAAEGIEGTVIEINDGTVSITAADDGINAGKKSTISTPSITINGGDISISMGAGDTDAIDANGNITINGGTVTITANSPFDFDGTGALNGGTVTVNGSVITSLSSQMMGGGMMGGMPGGWMSGFSSQADEADAQSYGSAEYGMRQ